MVPAEVGQVGEGADARVLGPHPVAMHLDLAPEGHDAGDAVEIRDRAAARRPVVRVDAALAVGVRGAVGLRQPALAEQQRAVGREALGVRLGGLPAQRYEGRGEPVPNQPPLPKADDRLDEVGSRRSQAGTFSGSFAGSGTGSGSRSGASTGRGASWGARIGSTMISLAGPGSVAAGLGPSSRMFIGYALRRLFRRLSTQHRVPGQTRTERDRRW